jgi:hypothetical protein
VLKISGNVIARGRTSSEVSTASIWKGTGLEALRISMVSATISISPVASFGLIRLWIKKWEHIVAN